MLKYGKRERELEVENMTGNYFVEERKNQKQQLLRLLNEHPSEPLDQLLGVFSMNTGLSMAAIGRMMTELKMTRLVKHEEVV